MLRTTRDKNVHVSRAHALHGLHMIDGSYKGDHHPADAPRAIPGISSRQQPCMVCSPIGLINREASAESVKCERNSSNNKE